MSFTIKKNVDKLGRIVLSKNMRDYYGISLTDKVDMIPTERGILIVKSSDDRNSCDADNMAESE